MKEDTTYPSHSFSSRGLVKAAYLGLLDREPDAEGLEIYRKALDESGNVVNILTDLLHSEEFRKKDFANQAPNIVRSVFAGLLRREPEPEALNAYSTTLALNQRLEDILQEIATSEEFIASQQGAGKLKYEQDSTFAAQDLEKDKIVFLHHPKTGGTTLHHALITAFDTEEVCPERFNRLRNYPAGALARYRFFSGHFDLPSAKLIPGNKKIITMMREPVARLISLYYFLKAHRPETFERNNLYLARLANKYSMAEFFAAEEVRSHPWINNSMTRVLTSTIQECRWECGSAAINPEAALPLEAAFYELESLDAFGIMEQFDESLRVIYRCIGLETPRAIESRQVLEVVMDQEPGLYRIQKEPITDEVRLLIENLVQTDIKLYMHACTLFEVRLKIPHKNTKLSVTTQDLVRATYLGLLNREPDTDGIIEYSAQLTTPENMSNALSNIIHSDEFISLQNEHRPKPGDTHKLSCFVFIHMQKTAGTSVQNMISESFNPETTYGEHDDTLYRYSPGELAKYKIFSGHFNYDSLAFIPHKSKSLITFMRRPKERITSLYRFWRAHQPDHASYHPGMSLASELSMETFLEHDDIKNNSHFWNHMVWAIMGQHQWKEWQMLLSSQTDKANTIQIKAKIIRPAICKRLQEFAFIGLQEDFDKSVNMLFPKMGIKAPKCIREDNKLDLLLKSASGFKDGVETQTLNSRLKKIFDGLTSLDNIVYKEGKRLFIKQLDGVSPRNNRNELQNKIKNAKTLHHTGDQQVRLKLVASKH